MDNSSGNSQSVPNVGKTDHFARSPSSPFGLEPQETLAYRKRFRGMISVASKVPLKDRSVLSLLYTPGVAAPCLAIAQEPLTAYDYTLRGNTIALVSDGSSALGFGNIGPMAALPLLEDACILFKTFGGVNAFPISLDTQDAEQIIATGIAIWPTFGGFCLSSIASPRCFAVTDYLARAVNIPVLHAEQHATAVTILAALSNALKLVGKAKEAVRVVINGSGPGGIGTARLLLQAGFQHILVCDRLGILERYRLHNMNWAKLDIARQTNPSDVKGTLEDALRGADVYIGLSSWSTLTPSMVSAMAERPILFTLALPDPGITPEAARVAGATVVATAHPAMAHPLTHALVLPGIFRGALDVRATAITQQMLLSAAQALADLVQAADLSPAYLVPSVMEYAVAPRIARAVAQAAQLGGVARDEKDPAEIEREVLTTIYEGHRPIPPPTHQYANLQEHALELHKRYQGVLEIQPKIPIRDSLTLSSLYLHPGLPEATQQISSRPDAVFDYTGKGNRVAVVTDGSAVLGLGNIGPRAALPVMEGKAILFHTFAGLEAYPICLATQDVDEIVAAVQRIAPAFGGINLEDISAPRCFEVEERLSKVLAIPVVHDDQHGTAIVILAGIMNALHLVNKVKQEVTAVLVGAGAAGIATANLLLEWGIGKLLLVDRLGILRPGLDGMTVMQEELAARTNPEQRSGGLTEAIAGADIFIGVSAPGILTAAMVHTMAPQAIVFALANPDPEILPEAAQAAGARVVATGRSDYPNQVNNSLVFPGLFRGALDVRARLVNTEMKLAAAERLASLVSERDLQEGQIIPQAMNYEVAPALAAAVAQAAMDSGVARLYVDAQLVARSCSDFIYEGIMAPVPALQETPNQDEPLRRNYYT
jgi:malate dehydrogenase (oxaloacetate-decarboxylating)